MAVSNTWFMNSLLISPLTTVLFLVCMCKNRQVNQSWFVLGLMNTQFCWSTNDFSFVIQMSEKSQFWLFYSSDCSTFLWSTCIQAGWWILHREKKSCTSIESCQRILYCKILDCSPRGISMLLLTHVLGRFSLYTMFLLKEVKLCQIHFPRIVNFWTKFSIQRTVNSFDSL